MIKRMTRDKRFWQLAGIVFLFLFLFLGEAYFNTKGEPREAGVALSILQQDNWILPVNNGVDIPYKPLFLHWCIALLSLLTGGVTEYTARFPSALALAVMVLAGYVFFSRRRGSQVAFVAALLTLTSFELHRAGTNCRVDMMLTALVVISLYLLYRWVERGMRGLPWWAVLCMSAAFLTKGPVGVLLPCLVTGIFLLCRGHDFRKVLSRFLLVGLVSCVVPLLWYVAAYRQGGSYFLQLVMEENLLRFLGKMSYASHHNPAYYNVLTVLAGFLPYTLLVLISLFWIRPRRGLLSSGWWERFKRYFREMDDVRLFSLLSIVVIFVFYCIPKSKRSVYLMPIYPFIAYFLAEYVIYLWRHKPTALRVYGTILSSLSLLTLAAFIVVRMGMIPETVFTGKHAAQNQAFLHALETVPILGVGVLLLAFMLFAAVFFLSLRGNARFQRWGLHAIFAIVFSIFMVQDGYLGPAVLNVKSDKPYAERIARIVPAGKVYSTHTAELEGDPVRPFSVNFYLGDRVEPFDKTRPAQGYLLACDEDARGFLQEHPGYSLELVYDSGHRSCDDRKVIQLYRFQRRMP